MIPKSLHTVTVLVRVARLLDKATGSGKLAPRQLVDAASVDLGYGNAADPYGLRAKATAILAADRS